MISRGQREKILGHTGQALEFVLNQTPFGSRLNALASSVPKALTEIYIPQVFRALSLSQRDAAVSLMYRNGFWDVLDRDLDLLMDVAAVSVISSQRLRVQQDSIPFWRSPDVSSAVTRASQQIEERLGQSLLSAMGSIVRSLI